jgi:hypothetical protein
VDRRPGHRPGGGPGRLRRRADLPRPARRARVGPTREGALGDADTARLAALAALAALLATGLLHLLLLSTPRPIRFFTWIVTLATIAAALAPFLTDADLDEKVATSAIYLAVGLAIGSLLSGVARSAVRRRG